MVRSLREEVTGLSTVQHQMNERANMKVQTCLFQKNTQCLEQQNIFKQDTHTHVMLTDTEAQNGQVKTLRLALRGEAGTYYGSIRATISRCRSVTEISADGGNMGLLYLAPIKTSPCV